MNCFKYFTIQFPISIYQEYLIYIRLIENRGNHVDLRNYIQSQLLFSCTYLLLLEIQQSVSFRHEFLFRGQISESKSFIFHCMFSRPFIFES